MCTSGANNMGTCIVSERIIILVNLLLKCMQIWQGDSGGSMNYKQMDGRWKQIGIISFGSTEGCQKKRVIQTVTTD